MNKYIMTLAIIGSLCLANKHAIAQEEQSGILNGKPAIYWLYDNAYRLSTKYDDYDVAKAHLYNLIAMEPQNDSLLFNLAYMYYESQKHTSSILVSLDILAINPSHAGALEISGVSYESLGLKDKALVQYEKLYMSTQDVNTLYKMIFLQYGLKKYAECKANLDILFSKPEINDLNMTFRISETEQKEFSMKIAAKNLRGLLYRDEGNTDAAKKEFEEILVESPEFIFAKTNLDEMNK